MNIAISLDIDWAPDACIEYTCDLLKKNGLKATFFATHQSPVIRELIKDNDFEVCPHPNYYSLFGDKPERTFEEITDECMQWFPDSKGVRTHGLLTGFPILNHYKKLGLKYDASMYVHQNHGIKPFLIFDDFYRIPHSFEDDVNFALSKNFEFKPEQIQSDLMILDFHPVHIYLNTNSVEHYESAKMHYQSPADLKKRKATTLGTETYFKTLLESCATNKFKTPLLSELI